MIHVSANRQLRTSPETVWRHLTRVTDWPRWYPGLHGVSGETLIAGTGATWRSSGQMGRLLYRATNEVIEYRMLESMSIQGDRRPWIKHFKLTFMLRQDGAYCWLSVTINATVSFRIAGRLLLTRPIQSRLEVEARQVCERLAAYAQELLPHH